MIKIEFKHEPAGKTPLHQDEYELIVQYQHGDNDGDTEKVHYYPVNDYNMYLDVLLIVSVASMGGCIEECEGFILSLVESQLPGVDPEEAYQVAENWRDKFHVADIQDGNRPAAVVGYRMFYYDKDGRSSRVDIYLNGNKIEQ